MCVDVYFRGRGAGLVGIFWLRGLGVFRGEWA